MRNFILALLMITSTTFAARPNIVLFISDDHSWHDVGAYGNASVRTPNLDRLASEGMRFDAAVCPSPTCTPSRSAIYTGLYPFRNGAHANHSRVNDDVKSWPQYLGELGYRVVLAGKTHIGPREVFPFEYLPDSNLMPAGKDHVLWTDLNTSAVEALLASHDKSKPLCLIVAAHSPHVYWPENEGYDPAKIELPPYLLDTPQTRVAMCRYFTDVTWLDKQVGEVLDALAQHGYAENTLFVYTSDHGAQFPFAKWNLYDAGIRAPLLVRWPGKVKAGATSTAVVSLVDLLPTAIEAAEGQAPSDIDGRSFLAVLQGQTDRHHEAVFSTHTGDGKMNSTPMRCVRTAQYKHLLNLAPETRYTTHISEGGGPDGKGYWTEWERLAQDNERAARFVERYRHRPAEELYDVQADPYELKNLADDPVHASVLADMRQRLKQWRLQQGENLEKVPMPEDARLGEIQYAR